MRRSFDGRRDRCCCCCCLKLLLPPEPKLSNDELVRADKASSSDPKNFLSFRLLLRIAGSSSSSPANDIDAVLVCALTSFSDPKNFLSFCILENGAGSGLSAAVGEVVVDTLLLLLLGPFADSRREEGTECDVVAYGCCNEVSSCPKNFRNFCEDG